MRMNNIESHFFMETTKIVDERLISEMLRFETMQEIFLLF